MVKRNRQKLLTKSDHPLEQDLEKIYASSIKLLYPILPEETYKVIVEEACKLTRSRYGSIFLLRHEVLYRAYSSVKKATRKEPRRFGNTFRSLQEKKPVIVTRKMLENTYPSVLSSGIESFILIPLLFNRKIIGIITLQATHDSSFNEKQIAILKLFGSMASMAIRKAQLHSDLLHSLQTRNLFISLAAHELKTPLTSLYGIGQLMQMYTQKGMKIKKEWIDSLLRESIRLTNLTNEFLSTNQQTLDTLSYKWKTCSLRKLIKQSIHDVSFTHPDNKILFIDKTSSKKDSVIGDPDRLLQVLINILNNAAKFSAAGKDITVRLFVKDATLFINIEDQGIGISKQDLPKVFDGFYRADHNKEGMGLGLFLAKTIVDTHNGSITIKTKLDKGTTITIKLPAL